MEKEREREREREREGERESEREREREREREEEEEESEMSVSESDCVVGWLARMQTPPATGSVRKSHGERDTGQFRVGKHWLVKCL